MNTCLAGANDAGVIEQCRNIRMSSERSSLGGGGGRLSLGGGRLCLGGGRLSLGGGRGGRQPLEEAAPVAADA